jgi:hypothetical protein
MNLLHLIYFENNRVEGNQYSEGFLGSMLSNSDDEGI